MPGAGEGRVDSRNLDALVESRGEDRRGGRIGTTVLGAEGVKVTERIEKGLSARLLIEQFAQLLVAVRRQGAYREIEVGWHFRNFLPINVVVPRSKDERSRAKQFPHRLEQALLNPFIFVDGAGIGDVAGEEHGVDRLQPSIETGSLLDVGE